MSVSSQHPADDSGRDAFTRFRYQAHVAFFFCLDCALAGDVKEVVPEHFEDIAVGYGDEQWRFVPIKTRDPERGPWSLADLLADGGAFRSLLRTHLALQGLTGTFEYEIRLEGAIKRGDEAECLLPGGEGPSPALVDRCMDRLEIDRPTCEELLVRSRIRHREPARELIEAENLRRLGLAYPQEPYAELKRLYDEVIALIEAGMTAELLQAAWPSVLLEPDSQEDEVRLHYEATRIDSKALRPLFDRLTTTPTPLLRELGASELRATALEEKLIAADATSSIVEDAKLLRANAAYRETEIEAASLSETQDMLTDLRTRARIVANAVAGEAKGTSAPGSSVWANLLARLSSEAHTVDPSRLLAQDPMLLLGLVCQISDECDFGWGISSA